MKIPEEIIEQIMQAAKVLEVVEHFQQMKKAAHHILANALSATTKKRLTYRLQKIYLSVSIAK